MQKFVFIRGSDSSTFQEGISMLQLSQNYWENFIAVLLAFAVLSLIIERALYQIFDSKIWKDYLEKRINDQLGADFFDIKPWISVAVSVSVVFKFKLDMIAVLFEKTEPKFLSMLITGFFIAGGSTGVYKFFKQLRKLREAHYHLEIFKKKAEEEGQVSCSENNIQDKSEK